MEDGGLEDWNTSYLYGWDNQSGWGGRYFFTYYSEFRHPSSSRYLWELSALVFTFIVSLIANLSIIACVSRNPEMRTVTNCFVLNLAYSDIVLTLTIPVVAYTRISGSWVFGNIACSAVPYFQFVSGSVLLWTFAFISIDRHRCIVIPPYRSQMSIRQANYACVLIWLATSSALVPVPLWFREVHSNDLSICTLIFPHVGVISISIVFIVMVVVFACIIPMTLLFYHNHQIFCKIMSTKNAWSTSCVVISDGDISSNRVQGRRQSELSISDILVPWPRRFSTQLPGSRQGSLSTQEELRLNKHIKVIRILSLNVLVVFLMWLPITIIMVLIHVDGRRNDQNFFLRSHHFIIALIIAFLNTVVNPLLYGFFSDSFRACLIKIWCRRDDTVSILDPATPSSARILGRNKRPSASFSEKSDRFDVDKKLAVELI